MITVYYYKHLHKTYISETVLNESDVGVFLILRTEKWKKKCRSIGIYIYQLHN